MDEIQLLERPSGSVTSDGEFVEQKRIEAFDYFLGSSEYLKTLYNEFFIDKFNKLKIIWLDETQNNSLSFDSFQHPAYLEIIRLGHFMIPILLNDLRRERHHWFMALMVLTGSNPVLPEHAGDINEMVSDWITWGKNHGFIH